MLAGEIGGAGAATATGSGTSVGDLGGGTGIVWKGRTRPALQSAQNRGRSFRNFPPLRQA